jgi:uncharacterized protein YndB with AHSA1/START domain
MVWSKLLMNNHLTGHATVLIDAPAEKVWEALTNPEIIRKYFFGTNTITDWKVGSPIRFTGEFQGTHYEDNGTILTFEPYSLIRYKYWSSMSGTEDKPENHLTITYELLKENNKTRLNITQENIRDIKAREHSEENWRLVLANLKRVVEDLNKVLAF